MTRPVLRSYRLALSASILAALSAACGSPSTGASAINVQPANLDEAKETAAQLHALLTANPSDAEALAAQRAFNGNLDAINHVVARVEPAPGHVVKFFDTGDGSVVIEESHPKGEASALAGVDMDSLSNAALFRQLSGGQEAPEALARLDVPGAVAKSELTPGLVSKDETEPQTSSRFHTEMDPFNCYFRGDFHSCQPGWWNGGWYNWNTKTSFLELQPISGGTLYVQYSYNNGAAGGFIEPASDTGGVYEWWARSGTVTTRSCGFLGLGSCTYQTDFVIGNHAWTLVNAQGTEFNWSTEAFWNCTWTACMYK
jgi:hypothetical protein